MFSVFHFSRIRVFILICIVSLLTMQLTGCKTSSHSKKDGPPKRPPAHLDRVPDAVPKVEPLSRYGNRFKNNSKTYVEKRKRYSVMQTSRGYKAKGLASWYGTKFHGRRTSSGEKYDMYAMTAAHRTLPLPTYAKVTNLDNGKSVIVKVNDRGPFHKNRLIDVSYVAAHKLGMLAKGMGRVQVESVDPRDHHGFVHKRKRGPLFAPKPKHTPVLAAASAPLLYQPNQKLNKAHHKSHPALKNNIKNKSMAANNANNANNKPSTSPNAASSESNKLDKKVANKKYYVQFGSFNQKSGALALAKQAGKLSKMPTRITEYRQKQQQFFKVRIGPLTNHQEALQLSQKLSAIKGKSVVVID